jgi:hypothetical protein
METLFVVGGDPRVSPRPAEAVRIAAGVSVWKKVTVTVFLSGPAVLALGEFADELVDADNFTRYLPVLTEAGGRVLAEEGARELAELGSSAVAFRVISMAQLADLAAASRYVLRF